VSTSTLALALALALEITTTVLVGVSVLAVVLLLLIVVAPWKQVRDEPPLDPDVEAELLLRRDPDELARDLPSATVADLDDLPEDMAHDAGYDDLREL
jgi:hypothetical protein